MGTYLESSQISASSKLCLTYIYPRLPVMWQRKAENRLFFGIFKDLANKFCIFLNFQVPPNGNTSVVIQMRYKYHG